MIRNTSAVDLKFLQQLQQIRRGTSNRKAALEHDPEKWEPVFGKRSCSSNKPIAAL
jgi:hypothetical protein